MALQYAAPHRMILFVYLPLLSIADGSNNEDCMLLAKDTTEKKIVDDEDDNRENSLSICRTRNWYNNFFSLHYCVSTPCNLACDMK